VAEGKLPGGAEERAPDSPAYLSKTSWKHTLKRTFKEFQDDGLTDWAAALTYYGVLALFPALIALVSIIGLAGASASDPLLDNLTSLAPGPARDIATNAIETISANQSSAGVALVLGLLGAIYSASGYVGAFARASNAIWEVEEGRSFWKLKPWQFLTTAAMLMMLSVCALAVFATGPVAEEVGNVIGVGDTGLIVWDIAKWPVIALVVSMLFAFLYWSAPNVEQPKFRWITPGGILAVVLWLAASGLFALYVALFSNYNATYGALAGVVVFLVWLWITNIAILLGAELNAEIERSRELEAGVPMGETIALPPREPADEDDPEDAARREGPSTPGPGRN
jgi:membrane protein